MNDPLIQHHRAMLDFERGANARVLDSLRSVPDHRRADPAFAKARSLLAHNQMARRMWLSRLGAITKPQWIMFPDWPIDRISAECDELHALYGAYLAAMRDPDLSRAVRYTSTEGVNYESTVAEILTHVHNHSTYHRGQVAALVTPLGGQRAVTDYIALTRRTV